MDVWRKLQVREELRRRNGGEFTGSGRFRAVVFDPREQDELARRRMVEFDKRYLRDMDEALGEGFIRREIEARGRDQVLLSGDKIN